MPESLIMLANVMFPQLTGLWKEVNLNEFAQFLDFSKDKENPLINSTFQSGFVKRIHTVLHCDYSYGGYLEDRSTLWRGHYHDPNKMIHLGVDFNVPEGTTVCMPYSGRLVHIIHDKDQNGGWGGRLTFFNEQHQFYFILGHLDKLVDEMTLGVFCGRGVHIGYVGNSDENGGWYPHVHLQMVSKAEYESLDHKMLVDGYASMSHDLNKRYPEPSDTI